MRNIRGPVHDLRVAGVVPGAAFRVEMDLFLIVVLFHHRVSLKLMKRGAVGELHSVEYRHVREGDV